MIQQVYSMDGFPSIKLSYENIIHKKVYDNDVTVAIPEGKKYFVWFTYQKGRKHCLFINAFHKEQVKPVRTYFDSSLSNNSLGTLFYGTFFIHDRQSFFTVEDVLYWKGQNKVNSIYKDKLAIFFEFFKLWKHQEGQTMFGLPIMKNTYQECVKLANELKYKIRHVQYRYLEKSTNVEPILCGNVLNSSVVSRRPVHDKTKDFWVRPDIQNDIYHLYPGLDEEGEKFKSVALIPDYKTSVLMNKLFRNIKENINLDLLEESDDEDEFENENIDKFVDLNKVIKMQCEFNTKFNKWVPIMVK